MPLRYWLAELEEEDIFEYWTDRAFYRAIVQAARRRLEAEGRPREASSDDRRLRESKAYRGTSWLLEWIHLKCARWKEKDAGLAS